MRCNAVELQKRSDLVRIGGQRNRESAAGALEIR